ncbi:hypothetical protein Trco_004364 [Trichoderma cornu-damae]|uniref:Uncharacterized protein n=1 Tax=Trichoderma cornu-damae TaxID=654480 RepID=A0A9P8QKK7_9HYPO|nr:hypothetical protein Trco_004364 [Trichoderma cornu-damae]
MLMPVEQREDYFQVQMRHKREATSVKDVRAALEQIEARSWEDVVFVTYEDTPRDMRRWYTTREPRILQWGMNMI